MKKIAALLLFLLLFGPVVYAADKPLGVEEFTSVEELALSLTSYFPKVRGEVKKIEADKLIVSMSKKDGIIPGMVLTLWRDGKEILHPATKAVIGRAEDEVGTIEVVSVSDSSITAVMKKKVMDATPGDRARITPRKINMALVPLREEHPEVIRALAEKLNEYGRFNVLDPGKVDVFLKNSKTLGTATVRELGTTFGLDAVVSVGLYPSEGRLMATARIFYTEDASQLDTVVAMLDLKTIGKSELGEIKPFFTPSKEEKSVTPELPFVAQCFALGDFDGDGKPEYAFSDGSRLHIQRNEPSGWREVWTETANDKGAMTTLEWEGLGTVVKQQRIEHINVDAGDINGNGKPELFVTGMLNGVVFSYVLEFQNGSFHRIAQVPGFLRLAAYPGKGMILLGQAYDASSFMKGPIRQYTWSQDNKYSPSGEVELPKGLGLYGWTFANFGERSPLLAVLDQDDHLLVYSAGALAWKSADQYPIVDRYIQLPETGIAAVLKQTEQSDKSRRVRLRGRLLALDVNGDGRDELILPKNTTSMLLGGFTGAELNGLGWTGSRLDPVWSVRDIAGPVIDFRTTMPDAAGTKVTALVKTKGSVFTKDRQQVMIYSVR